MICYRAIKRVMFFVCARADSVLPSLFGGAELNNLLLGFCTRGFFGGKLFFKSVHSIARRLRCLFRMIRVVVTCGVFCGYWGRLNGNVETFGLACCTTLAWDKISFKFGFFSLRLCFGYFDTSAITVEVLWILKCDVRVNLVSFGASIRIQQMQFLRLAASPPLLICLNCTEFHK